MKRFGKLAGKAINYDLSTTPQGRAMKRKAKPYIAGAKSVSHDLKNIINRVLPTGAMLPF